MVVVKDGQVLTERGYGYSERRQEDARSIRKTTLFRPGSISKLFTWTALMQQVEQGKVDLNADVNKYIDFKIPPYEGKPITVLNLMTHTPGFEEQVKDLITLGQDKHVPYDTLLKRWVPKRVYAPGTTPAYSNYGASLAGYIVQRTSGRAVRRLSRAPHLRPARDGAFDLPPAASGEPQAADGRGLHAGQGQALRLRVRERGAGRRLAATGDDMAKFMIAHLQNGNTTASRS